jgi:hypothetical protein
LTIRRAAVTVGRTAAGSREENVCLGVTTKSP